MLVMHKTLVFPKVDKCTEEDGPFWLTQAQRLATQTNIKKVKRDKNVVELLVEIRASGFDTLKKRYLKSELVKLSEERNIPATF